MYFHIQKTFRFYFIVSRATQKWSIVTEPNNESEHACAAQALEIVSGQYWSLIWTHAPVGNNSSQQLNIWSTMACPYRIKIKNLWSEYSKSMKKVGNISTLRTDKGTYVTQAIAFSSVFQTKGCREGNLIALNMSYVTIQARKVLEELSKKRSFPSSGFGVLSQGVGNMPDSISNWEWFLAISVNFYYFVGLCWEI